MSPSARFIIFQLRFHCIRYTKRFLDSPFGTGVLSQHTTVTFTTTFLRLLCSPDGKIVLPIHHRRPGKTLLVLLYNPPDPGSGFGDRHIIFVIGEPHCYSLSLAPTQNLFSNLSRPFTYETSASLSTTQTTRITCFGEFGLGFFTLMAFRSLLTCGHAEQQVLGRRISRFSPRPFP